MHIMSSVVASGGGGDRGRPPRAAHLEGRQNCTFGVDKMVRMKDESFQRYKKFGKNAGHGYEEGRQIKNPPQAADTLATPLNMSVQV